MPRTTSQPHPLAPYAERIQPDALYTVRQIAALLEMAPTSVSGMVQHGWFPGRRTRSHARGGRQHTWTGKQLLRIATRPIRITYDHELYTPATLYRVGCRCPRCVDAHVQESRERRRALAEERFTAAQRQRVLELTGQGVSIAVAAKQAGVTTWQVYGRATWDLAFAEELDEAGWTACVLGSDHPLCSKPAGYRGNERGPVPRPACRGTGCREWRRGMAQRERATAAAE